MLACSSPLLNVFSRLLPLISIFASHLLFAFLHDGFAAVATRWKFQNQGVSGRRESRLRNFFQEIESNLRSMEVQFGMNDFLNWNIYEILYPDSISGYPDIRILYPDIRILYPKLVCFGYHFLENFPFSLHYCYVKITIFHPVVSKIKLRFYLKPGNREPMFECWDESGSEHPDMVPHRGVWSRGNTHRILWRQYFSMLLCTGSEATLLIFPSFSWLSVAYRLTVELETTLMCF